MLRLMQVIQYMLLDLEYSVYDVELTFQDIQDGKYSFIELLDVLNLESASGTLDMLAVEKINAGRWQSALAVVKMKIGA